jgi:type IV pilus assembly protein PilQ
MLKIIALSMAILAPESVVRGLTVTPVADRTQVTITVDGAASISTMTLSNPDRLVIDFGNSRHAGGLERFDQINRGGVRGIRVAQFQPTVVRVVIDLDRAVDHAIEQSAGEVRLTFSNPAGSFETWSTLQGASPPPQEDTFLVGSPVALPAAAVPPPVQQAAVQVQQSQAAVQVQSQAAVQAQRQPAVAPVPAAVPARNNYRPISVTFVNEPVYEVISTLGAAAGRSIIAAQDVRNRLITAEVTNQPWDMALEAILQANGLYAREIAESGVIIIEDIKNATDRRRDEPMVVRHFPIEYVSADSLRQSVQGLLSDRGRVTVNSQANALIITAPPTEIAQLESVLRQMDVQQPQVNIAATIAFIDRTALEQYGVIYDLKDTRGNQLNRMHPGIIQNSEGQLEQTDANVVLLGGSSIAALANANHRVPGAALELITSLVLGRHTLVTFLEALQTVSLSEVQAKPVVQTMNHRQATIQVGESTPIRVIDAGAGSGGDTGPRAVVSFRDTGIILRVTPHIVGNQVMLDLHAERSGIALAPADIGATFPTQSATTQVLVNDGETAVIGGLTITEKSRVRSGIPLLMDLPVVGALFRNTAERENKRDLLIMVTPHIIR